MLQTVAKKRGGGRNVMKHNELKFSVLLHLLKIIQTEQKTFNAMVQAGGDSGMYSTHMYIPPKHANSQG